jgi:hypothetical protein
MPAAPVAFAAARGSRAKEIRERSTVTPLGAQQMTPAIDDVPIARRRRSGKTAELHQSRDADYHQKGNRAVVSHRCTDQPARAGRDAPRRIARHHPQRDKEHQFASRKYRRESTTLTSHLSGGKIANRSEIHPPGRH